MVPGVVIKLSSHYPEDLLKDYEPWLLLGNLSFHHSTGPQGLTNEASEVLSCQIDFFAQGQKHSRNSGLVSPKLEPKIAVD